MMELLSKSNKNASSRCGSLLAPWMAVLLLVIPSTLGRTDDYFGRTACYNVFALAGFDILDFDKYPNFFNDTSIMQLAQTGTYQGAAGIEEYVRFASPTSPYIEAIRSYDKSASIKTASDPETGECVITVVVTSAAKYSDIVDPGRATTRSTFLKIFYDPTSWNTIAISKIYVHYELPYLNYFFGNLTNQDQTRDFICSVMMDKCPNIWSLNGLSSKEECMTELAALPVAGDEADISGNTQGCRVLHSVFASMNPAHCPHISFVPVEDEHNEIKCQTSSFRPVNEMFDDEDLQVFNERRAELGLDNEMAAEVCNCNAYQLDQDNANFFSKFSSGFVNFMNGLASIGPLPETWRYGDLPYCEICTTTDGEEKEQLHGLAFGF